MFHHHGLPRTDRDNTLLAAYLACVGGYVNSAGFVLIGTFTSHVTGNVGRFASQLVSRQLTAALAALSMVFAFFAGALAAGLIVDSRKFSRAPAAYGAALSFEAVLLGLFGILASGRIDVPARLRDEQALLLCLAMGVQNSLVTRLSGAVVRTTHLTGIVTDLGIETARWLSRWRIRSGGGSGAPPRPSGRPSREPPLVSKIRLHLIIVSSFILGGVLGCALTLRWHQLSMLVPSVVVLVGAGFAFASARTAPLGPSGMRRNG